MTTTSTTTQVRTHTGTVHAARAYKNYGHQITAPACMRSSQIERMHYCEPTSQTVTCKHCIEGAKPVAAKPITVKAEKVLGGWTAKLAFTTADVQCVRIAREGDTPVWALYRGTKECFYAALTLSYAKSAAGIA